MKFGRADFELCKRIDKHTDKQTHKQTCLQIDILVTVLRSLTASINGFQNLIRNSILYRYHICITFSVQPKGADRKHKTDREKMEKRGNRVRICYVLETGVAAN